MASRMISMCRFPLSASIYGCCSPATPSLGSQWAKSWWKEWVRHRRRFRPTISQPYDSDHVAKLVPTLKVYYRKEPLKMRNPDGPFGRLVKLRKTVTALVKYERIELNYLRAVEARGYAERLITEALRNGDCHRPTMELTDFWLEEKQLIHKLFKVLVPRYENYDTSYTRLYKAPGMYPESTYERAILELKENPYPPVIPHETPNHLQIHNILLNEAKLEYRGEKSSSDGEDSSPFDLRGRLAATQIAADCEGKHTEAVGSKDEASHTPEKN